MISKMSVYCIPCNRIFSNQSNLNKHTRVVHKINNISAIEYEGDLGLFKCMEGCKVSFKYNMDLRKHLQQKHEFRMEVEEKTFATDNDFQIWLKVEEKNNDVRYVKSTGKKQRYNNKKVKMYYDCVRSGKVKIKSDAERKRNAKNQGTSKINKCCTSQIIITKNPNSEECLMKYFKCHYGHGNEIQHLRLSKSHREGIASKLIMGVSESHIIDCVRNNITNELKRDDLLTREDIKNIKYSYNIHLKDGYRNKNDAFSVALRVEEWKNSELNPILFFKRQGELTSQYDLEKEDFCLIFMNHTQRELLKKFGNEIICLDSTHGLNPYDFELTTILAIDEFGQGFPMAFMFTNRKDTFINEVFFREVQKVVGTINPHVFMSDITSVFSKAWQEVMGPIERELFCSWHVDRAWQKNLKKVQDPDIRNWVYKTLKYIQTTLVEENFETEFVKFLEILSSKLETVEMFNYINSYYTNNTLKWAYCYRKKAGINTNMHIESMHKVIKYIYLDGKKIKRLDNSLNALEKYVRDKIIERIIKLTKGKVTEHHNIIHARHRSAITLKLDVKNTEEDNYLLISDKSEHLVTKMGNSICCELVCKFCKICIHMFECTCLDYSIRNTICKHIHYICLNVNPEVFSTHLDSCDSLKLDEVNCLVEDIGLKTNHSPDTLKQEIEFTALQIIEKVKSTHHGVEDLQLILQNLKTVARIVSMENNETLPLAASSMKASIEDKETEKLKLEPANKKIKKQSFFTTKKKQKKSLCGLKPNYSESKTIKELLTTSLLISDDPRNDHLY